MGFPRFFSPSKSQRIPSHDGGRQPVGASHFAEYQSPPYHDRQSSLKLSWNVDEQPSTKYKSETASLNASFSASSSDGSNRVSKMWNSIWLQTKLLASFVVLFVLLFVVTIVLYGVSEKYHGLSAEDVTRQYG
ncbi:hypothetical protein RRF57_011593 [Xylaria bambusicola]|uniref:Uncharacterized protein n=1 Tax=Xylaria bambusicola TaxID=326684 RepID=A0AAN7V0U5_9PEZI